MSTRGCDATLQQVVQEISEITDQRIQNNIAASAFILAALVVRERDNSTIAAEGTYARVSNLSSYPC